MKDKEELEIMIKNLEEIKQEQERILKVGGRIHPMRDEDGDFIGPLRVYMKDKDMPGLAMTRSFGDNFASIAGTICEPEIKEHILVPEDKFIVLASDGLFEFISSEECVKIVGEFYLKGDVNGALNFLYRECINGNPLIKNLCRSLFQNCNIILNNIKLIFLFLIEYLIDIITIILI